MTSDRAGEQVSCGHTGPDSFTAASAVGSQDHLNEAPQRTRLGKLLLVQKYVTFCIEEELAKRGDLLRDGRPG
jgi:hypothetical protein